MEGLPLLDRVEVRPSASLNWVFFSEGVCTFEMSHGLQEGWHLSWKFRRHVATCRRRHNVSLQFWPDGSVSPTQN
jgi:hypothetical protein